jgi:hypothetical protein
MQNPYGYYDPIYENFYRQEEFENQLDDEIEEYPDEYFVTPYEELEEDVNVFIPEDESRAKEDVDRVIGMINREAVVFSIWPTLANQLKYVRES